MSIPALLEASSAGAAHICLGADRLFILLAIASLRRCGSDSIRTSFSWSLGHMCALLVLDSRALPWWRGAIEWNMYISGVMLVVFGLHVTFWQHMYADTDRFQHIWEVDWAEKDICEGSPSKRMVGLDPERGYLKRFHFVGDYMSLQHFLGHLPQFQLTVAAVLGFLQGLISPDFAFASGAAWSAQAATPTVLVYAAFCLAISACASIVCMSCWSLMSSAPRSARGHRSARRSIGIGLCGAGFLWLLLVIQLDIQIASANHQGTAPVSNSKGRPGVAGSTDITQCPLMVTIGDMSFASAPTWEMVEKLDPWWTTELLQKHRRPPFHFTIRPSQIGGCGVFADKDMPSGTHVGLAGILSGPWDYTASLVHVTPWLGIALNHCSHGNTALHREGSFLTLKTTKPVKKGQEISFDYDVAADTIPIERAQPNWTC